MTHDSGDDLASGRIWWICFFARKTKKDDTCILLRTFSESFEKSDFIVRYFEFGMEVVHLFIKEERLYR